MNLSELLARWRALAADQDNYATAHFEGDGRTQQAAECKRRVLRDCASELEAALAEQDGGWVPLAEAPLGVPLELWGREPTLQGVQPYEGGGWSLRLTLDTTWSDDPRPIFASHGLTHARLVTPPPCAREPADG